MNLSCFQSAAHLNRSIDDNLAITSMRWLGIHPQDITKYAPELTAHKRLKNRLTERERAKIKRMLIRPYSEAEPSLIAQLESLNEQGVKLGLEQFPNHKPLIGLLKEKLEKNDYLF